MWEQFKRIIKPRGAIVLTASGKFAYKLVMSNFEWFKYEWVIIKKYPSSPALASKQPMRYTEVALVFCDEVTLYYPQMTYRPDSDRRYNISRQKPRTIYNFSDYVISVKARSRKECYPSNIIHVDQGPPSVRNNQHPTQKTVALFEYLIRTYTQAGETVFDPVVGSGTTAIAARNTGRNFICGDNSEEYVQVARERLALPYTLPMFDEAVVEDKPVQADMFKDG